MANAANLCPQLTLKSWLSTGAPNAFGTVQTFSAGTNTPIATYTDWTAGTSNPNPVPLNSRGEANVFLLPNVGYKLVEFDSFGNQIKVSDQVVLNQLLTLFGGVDTGFANSYVLTFNATFSAYANGIVLYWIPSNSNTGASTLNVNGLGPISIVNPNGTVLGANQIVANQMTAVVYYNGVFQLLSTGNFIGANVGTFGSEVPLASAATTDLGSVVAHNVNITGSATITSFGSSAQIVAPIFVGRFTGSATLTQSTSLILPGNNNILTTPGDAFIAEYMGGGNWRVLIYQYISSTNALKTIKFSDSSQISNTTLTNDADLQITTLPLGQYSYEVFLLFDSVAAGAGFKWSANGTFVDSRGTSPASATGFVNAAAYGPKVESFVGATITYASVGTTSNSNQVLYKGSLLISTAGSFGVEWAQAASTGSNTTLRAGSYLIVTPLAMKTGNSPVTHTYTSPGAGVETIPASVTSLTIESWGGSGGGGQGFISGCLAAGGGGGGSGGYCRSVINVTGQVGKTINYTVGAAGVTSGPGGASPITSGTLSITTMNANGGGGGGNAPNFSTGGTSGAAGTASGGTASNTSGNAGAVGQNNAAGGGGGIGGAGISGINGGGNPGGTGGGFGGAATAGGAGVVVFAYS